MLWQRLFASFDADHGNHDLILGTAYGALPYFALYAIPQAVTAFLIRWCSCRCSRSASC